MTAIAEYGTPSLCSPRIFRAIHSASSAGFFAWRQRTRGPSPRIDTRFFSMRIAFFAMREFATDRTSFVER